jgi:hypothetical protein
MTTKTVRTYSATEDAALEVLRNGPVTMNEAIQRPLMLGAFRSLTKRNRLGKVGVVYARGAYRLAVSL